MVTIPNAASMRELYNKQMEIFCAKELTDTVSSITDAAKNAKSSIEVTSLCNENMEALKKAGYTIKISVDQDIDMETYIVSW
jgi:hypothetical protein